MIVEQFASALCIREKRQNEPPSVTSYAIDFLTQIRLFTLSTAPTITPEFYIYI